LGARLAQARRRPEEARRVAAAARALALECLSAEEVRFPLPPRYRPDADVAVSLPRCGTDRTRMSPQVLSYMRAALTAYSAALADPVPPRARPARPRVSLTRALVCLIRVWVCLIRVRVCPARAQVEPGPRATVVRTHKDVDALPSV